MKTFLVAAWVLIPGMAWAGAETNGPASAGTAASAPELAGLTPEQQKMAEAILATEGKKRKTIEEDKSLQPMQKQVQISMLHRDTLQQIQALKTPATPPAPVKP